MGEYNHDSNKTFSKLEEVNGTLSCRPEVIKHPSLHLCRRWILLAQGRVRGVSSGLHGYWFLRNGGSRGSQRRCKEHTQTSWPRAAPMMGDTSRTMVYPIKKPKASIPEASRHALSRMSVNYCEMFVQNEDAGIHTVDVIISAAAAPLASHSTHNFTWRSKIKFADRRKNRRPPSHANSTKTRGKSAAGAAALVHKVNDNPTRSCVNTIEETMQRDYGKESSCDCQRCIVIDGIIFVRRARQVCGQPKRDDGEQKT